MKCKHENVSIIEFGTAQTSHDRESSGEWTHVSDIGHYTGVIEASCSDCGIIRRYNRYAKNLPKWLKVFLNEISGNYEKKNKEMLETF